ncbi:MAG: SGNH/GDSL hydrolase family protein [Aeromicrobium sp.]|nr:SGNH/GDSL hydrolase family protein [Burkholderiales bacterium]
MNKKWLAAGMLGATLLIGETIARFGWGLGDPPLSVAHPTIEYMFKPDQNVKRLGNHIIVNHYGMRSENFPAKKSTNERRVMIFGDSVVNGGNLTDHSDLASSILKSKLTEILGKVCVGNISAGRWGPGNWLAYAKEYGFFDADIIILVISSHDAYDNPTFAPLDPNVFPQRKPISALWEGLTRYLPQYIPKVLLQTDSPAKFGDAGPVDDVAEIAKGIHDLKNFLRLAQGQTQHVLVVQYPEQSELASGSFKTGYAEIKQAVQDMGIVVISMAPPFIEQIHRGQQPYRDNIHPNNLGQKIIAETLYEALVLHSVLDR